MMKPVTMYATVVCPFCVRAEALLRKKGASIEKLYIDKESHLRDEMIAKTKRRTVPQIYIGDTHVGGCDELYELEAQGKLNALLEI